MPITFHPINNSVIEVLKQHYPILKDDNELKDVFLKNSPLVAFRKDKSLKDNLGAFKSIQKQ